MYDNHWVGLIAHPPCTYLSVSGLHWNTRRHERARKTEEALQFVQMLMDAPIPHKVIENPVSCISTHIRKPDQIIQPYWFGDDASKKTCLWMENVNSLKVPDETLWFPGRDVIMPNGKFVKRWSNQTDSGQSNVPPGHDRWKIRSKTYPGIAKAVAQAMYDALKENYEDHEEKQ